MATLNPRQIEAFRLVMLRGSVTAAAQLLKVSQPAVSRLIRDLEVRTGLSLFERRGNQLVPTPEASEFLAEVERYSVGLQALTTFAHELANLKRGSLRIVAMPALAMGFLPRFVAGFIEGRNLSQVYLHGTGSHLVVDAMAAGQADVGFAAVLNERPCITVEPVTSRVVAVVPRSHPFAKRRAIGVKDLKGENIVALAEPTIFARSVPRDLDAILRTATIVTPLTSIACQFVSAGAGIALVDPFSVAGSGDPNLVALPFEPAIPIRIGIVTGSNRPLSSLTTEFIAAFKSFIDVALDGRETAVRVS